MNEIGRKITDKLIELHGSSDFTICFLPYKRSMWDSMKSVYEECIASGAHVHLLPLPYFRMQQGRRIDYVDIDDFGNIAEPIEYLDRIAADYIVIHYQYDGNNAVTQMLPQYYTKAIKERTGAKVVYIPYGIPYGGLSNRHFRLQPGLEDVDYYFVQSEEECEGAIRDWATRGIDLTGRIFGFGSPKIDAILKAERKIPHNWLPKIEDRPVTLLTNSLGPYLQRPYEKIVAYNLIIEEELIKSQAVIFRPHPLLRTTIRAMRPDTEPAYNKFLERYHNHPHVIIDISENLERALGIADYLISDPSSVVEMWKATGKPYEVI